MSQPVTVTKTMYAVIDTTNGELVSRPCETWEDAERTHQFFGWINSRAERCRIGPVFVSYEVPAAIPEEWKKAR